MQNPITTGDVLTYDEETGQWQNCPFEFLLEDYAPTLTIETDNVSIENIGGVLQLKDFGTGYYAYIPAVKDKETDEIITPSTYKYTEGFISGLEPRIIADEDNNLCLAWYEPGAETVEDIAANIEDISKSLDNLNQVINAENGLSNQIKSLQTQTNQISTDLESVKSNKADANSVYTKDEIDESFENIYTKEEINNSFNNVYTKEETNVEIGKAVAAADHLKRVIVENEDEIINSYFDKEDYDTYIFMIPTGLEEDSNKYNEYLIVDIDGMKAIEKVGSWEVDLKAYAKKEEIGYAEGSRLITNSEAIKLTSIEEGAQKNYITSVDENNFSVKNGMLQSEGLKAVIADVGNLNNVINGYIDNNGEQVSGLVATVSELTAAVASLEQTNANLSNIYVKKILFNSTIQELTSLITNKETNIINLTTRVDGIEKHLIWYDIENEQGGNDNG